MLRTILTLALIAVAVGIGYLIGVGRTTGPVTVSTPPPPAPVVAPPAREETRARTEALALPEPPPVSPESGLKGPSLPQPATPQTAAPQPIVPQPTAPLPSAPLPSQPRTAPQTQADATAPAMERRIGLPIAALKASDIQDTFMQSRANGERRHEATDILAPKGTPVVAVDAGIVAKLFTSKPGGLTVYQFDPSQHYAYYYAHLDRYAEGLKEGMLLKPGDKIGYVGVTGNSDPNVPHLHFAIFELGPEKHWWEGKPVNPYTALMRAVRK